MRLIRRSLPVLLALCLLLTAGCSGLFDRSYYSSEPYQAPADQEGPEEPDRDAGPAYDGIADFSALRRAVLQMVSDHQESAQLQFAGYEGSISQDISAACWEVKSSTALGAFAVDYISYDLSRIVSYYQAEINITYKRSAAQVEALERTPTVSSLTARLDRALRAGETYLVLEIADGSATADSIGAYVSGACLADPLSCPVVPEVEVGLFPETGVDRIAELSLNYGLDPAELAGRREELDSALEELTAGLVPAETDAPETDASETDASETDASETDAPAPSPDPREAVLAQAQRLQTLCARLMDRCAADDRAGSTAWDALAAGRADSQGLALALEAGCQALGLDCQVVSGRVDNEPHCWNIVTLDGNSYHVDVSGTEDGAPVLFLDGDEQLLGAYWWDTSDYPPCPEKLHLADEPEPTAVPLPTPSPEVVRSPAPVSL